MNIPKTSEPLATASSFFFTAAGIFIAIIDFESSQALTSALIMLGSGSAAFHFGNSKKKTPAHRLDEGAIYAVALCLAFHAWQSIPAVLIVGVFVLSFGVLFLDDLDSMILLPVLMLIIAAGIAFNTGLLEAIITAGIAIIALAVRTVLKQTDPVHSTWHFLTAFDVALAWFFIYRIS